MSSPSPSTTALDISGLSHSFGARKALDDVSVQIEAAQYAVLLGLNGAGKTTLFSLVTRLYNNRSGSIRVFGHDLRRAPGKALRQLGVVFQQRTLDLDLSVMQNLIYHGALHGFSRAETRRRAEEELERLGLADRAKEKVRRLSGGQMRRVEIARALLHRPRLLLLDEPTVGLDIESRQSIMDHIQKLCRDEGLGVLWATHLIDEVLPDSQVIVLHQGQILSSGPVAQLVRDQDAADVQEAFRKMTRSPAGEKAA